MPFDLFVNGTLMRGLALHGNLKGAPFVGEAATEPRYRLYSIGGAHPGMFRLADHEPGGISVPGEVYTIADALWPEVEAGEPPGLYRGEVMLADGRLIWGILYPRALAEGIHRDISDHGGWRASMAATAGAALGPRARRDG